MALGVLGIASIIGLVAGFLIAIIGLVWIIHTQSKGLGKPSVWAIVMIVVGSLLLVASGIGLAFSLHKEHKKAAFTSLETKKVITTP